MKSFLNICFSLSCFVLLFSSCAKKNEAGKMIPYDALFVTQLNIQSLRDKISLAEIRQTSWYQKAIKDSSTGDLIAKFLANPGATGIDFDKGLVFFSAPGSDGKYLGAEGTIKNIKDFEQFNKNAAPAEKIRIEGNISLLTLENKDIAGWDDDHFVYLMNNPKSISSRMNLWNDSSATTQQETAPDRSAELSVICKNLFSLKSDSSLAKNERFASLLQEPGDIHVWQNTEAMMKSASSMGIIGMLKLDAFIKDNVSTNSVRFDKGKIHISQKVYAGKELTDILRKYTGHSVNMNMIKNIPSQNVFALLAFNFKPEGIAQLIKLSGADGLINMFARQRGFNPDDFSKAVNGDWLVAFTDLKITMDSTISNPTKFNYIFSTGVGNKASLQKILDTAKKITNLMREDSMIRYVMNDQTFALSNSTSFARQYLNGNNHQYDFSHTISGHPVGFFLDLHKILTEFSSIQSKNDMHESMLDQGLKTWNTVTSSGGDFNAGGFTFNTEINLINKDTNSLKQLNHYLDELFKIAEAHKKESSKSTHRLDSLLVPPPIDTIK